MFKRSHLAIVIPFLLLFATACTLTQPRQNTDATPEQSPQATNAPASQVNQPSSAATSTPFTDRDETPRNTAASLSPNAQELPTVEVVEILTPSVVQIVTQTLTTGFFTQPIPSQGVGTGVILDTEGHILTNNHVINGAQRIEVSVDSGESYTAQVIGQDPSTDLAVIKIDAQGLQPARLGTSSKLRVGEDVIAIGHALGLPGGPTVSKGVVSALGRTIDTGSQNTIVDLIQIDAEINPGNSGGPLVNNKAEVVGINTAIIESGRGIGFSINIDDAKAVMRQLMDNGFVNRGFIGVTPVNLTPGIASRYNLPVSEGIILARVIRGSAAENAGLRAEDIITSLGGEPIRNNGELSKFLIAHPPGETIEAVFIRNGQTMTTQITLGARPR